MCKVKTGADIKNRNVVQSLNIGVINRQQKDYYRNQIYEMVAHHFDGAECSLDLKDVGEMIGDNLQYLYKAGFIDCWDGMHSPQVVSSRRFFGSSY